MALTDAMFRSAHQALQFAFEMQHKPILDRYDVSRGPSSGRWGGLGRHEIHAQAAMIRALVERMPGYARDYILAYYQAQVDILVSLALGNVDEAYRLMVEQYYGFTGSSINQVRKLLRCRKARALQERRRVYDTLDQVHQRAMAEITQRLVELGLIESDRLCD